MTPRITCPLDDLVTEVARLAYPNRPLFEAKKKVRDRITYPRKKGQLTVGGNAKSGLTANRMDFLLWAQNTWPKIAEELKLPGIGTLAAPIPSLAAQFSAVSLPADPDELKRDYIAKDAALLQKTMQLVDSSSKIKELKKQIAAMKKEAIRKKRSAAGKQGGRGHEK